MKSTTAKQQDKGSSASPADIFMFPRISNTAISGDNHKFAYSTFSLKKTAKQKYWQHQLYLKTANAKTTTLVKTADTITAIQWSHDSEKLAYLQSNPAKQQNSIWIFHAKNQTSYKLVTLKQNIIAFKWSPNDKQIAFVAEDLNYQPHLNPHQPMNIKQRLVNMGLYTIAVRPQKQPHIDALTSADYSISCEMGTSSFDWSPDGKSIAFAYQPQHGLDFIKQSKISIIDLATRKITKIPYTETQTGINPIFSPNGKWLAFNASVATNTGRFTTEIIQTSQICITEIAKLAHTFCLANTPNETPNIIGWHQDSEGVFVYDMYKTQGPQIYFLSLTKLITAQVIPKPKGYLNHLTLALNSSGTTFSFAQETLEHPPEVYISATNLEALQPIQISNLTKVPLAPLGKVQTIRWNSIDNQEIEGLLLVPYDYDSKKQYPLYLMIHGAPCVWTEHYLGRCEEYGQMFDPTTCISLLLQLGFIILQPNYRGSIGYGKEFRLANSGDWGGNDYADVMSGVDYLVNTKLVDPERMVIAGWSYGAYMTNLAVGRTQRFKAAIAGDGMTDLLSLLGTSDIPQLVKQDLGGYFWDNIKLYWQRSPMAQIKNIDTPLLIFHGKKDIRVPISQSYELCQALMLQNKPVTMLIFPEEGHMPADPNIIWAAIEAVIDWAKKVYHRL